MADTYHLLKQSKYYIVSAISSLDQADGYLRQIPQTSTTLPLDRKGVDSLLYSQLCNIEAQLWNMLDYINESLEQKERTNERTEAENLHRSGQHDAPVETDARGRNATQVGPDELQVQASRTRKTAKKSPKPDEG